MDPDRLAAEVYDHTVPDWPGEIDFYKALARSAASLLELACGTGRVCLRLAAPGTDVMGLDVSPFMLEIARRKAGGLSNISWFEGDMRSFDLRRTFDLAVIPGHSFQFMLTVPDQLSCLRSIRRHLASDALLVIHVDHMDLRWLASLCADPDPPFDPPTQVDLPDGRVFRVSKRWAYDPASQTASATTIFDQVDEHGGLIARTLRGPIELHCFFRYEVEHLLHRAGFAVEALYGDFSAGLLTCEAPDMIWLAAPADA